LRGLRQARPPTLIKNPVIFVLEIVTALTTIILVRDLVTGGEHIGFEFQIVLWLWFTVLFCQLLPKPLPKARQGAGDALRRQRSETKPSC